MLLVPMSLGPLFTHHRPQRPVVCHTRRKITAMLVRALSAAAYGIDANLVDVEVDESGVVVEKEIFHTVGLPDAAARESRDRLRAAIKNSGYSIPRTITTINLAPVDLRKEGSGFDLPIAVGILRRLRARGGPRTSINFYSSANWASTAACVQSPACCRSPSWHARGRSQILRVANAAEAAVVEGVNIFPVSSLLDGIDLLSSTIVGSVPRTIPGQDRRPTRRAATLFPRLQRCSWTANRQALSRSCCGLKPQHFHDLLSRFGQDHAREAPAIDSRATHF